MDHTNAPVNQNNNLGKDASAKKKKLLAKRNLKTKRVYNLTYDGRANRAKEIK